MCGSCVMAAGWAHARPPRLIQYRPLTAQAVFGCDASGSSATRRGPRTLDPVQKEILSGLFTTISLIIHLDTFASNHRIGRRYPAADLLHQ